MIKDKMYFINNAKVKRHLENIHKKKRRKRRGKVSRRKRNWGGSNE